MLSFLTAGDGSNCDDTSFTDPERVLVNSVHYALHSPKKEHNDEHAIVSVGGRWLPHSKWIRHNQHLLRPGFLRQLINCVKDYTQTNGKAVENDGLTKIKPHAAEAIIASLDRIRQEHDAHGPREEDEDDSVVFDDFPKPTNDIVVPINSRSRFPTEHCGDSFYMQHISHDVRDDVAARELAEFMACHIHDSEKVVESLSSRLDLLLQVAAKKIAKVWIKAICRKKQGIFPYQNKQREQSTGQPVEVPEWWPPVTECGFVEPDHVNKSQRISLLLHLLRLRPTATQLRQWNKGLTEINDIHASQGWTAFLHSVAPIEILDDVEPRRKDRKIVRRRLLREIYNIAAREEAYINGRTHSGLTFPKISSLEGEVHPETQVTDRKRRRSSLSVSASSSSSASSDQHDQKKLKSESHDVSTGENKQALKSGYNVLGNTLVTDVIGECVTGTTSTDRVDSTNWKMGGNGVVADGPESPPTILQALPGANFLPLQSFQAGTSAPVGSMYNPGSLIRGSISSSFSSDPSEADDVKPSPTEVGPLTNQVCNGYQWGNMAPNGDLMLVNYVANETQPHFDATPGISFLPATAMEQFSICGPSPSCYLQPEHYGNPVVSTSTDLSPCAMPGVFRGAGDGDRGNSFGPPNGNDSLFVKRDQSTTMSAFSHNLNHLSGCYFDATGTRHSSTTSHTAHKRRNGREGYNYNEVGSQQDFQSEALPGAVIRGFTGHGSGVGGGAWI